jgi:ATF/CREB family transcription factor
MSAAAKASQNIPNQANSNQTTQIAGTGDPKASTEQSQQGRLLNQTDSYHDANDAANGLFMLAQANSARNNNNSSGVKINTASNTKNNTTGNQFAVPGQPAQAIKTSAANSIGTQSQETSPVSQRGARASIASAGQGETGGDMSDSGHSEQTKPATRSRGKKGGNARSQTGGRRKAEESPAKTPASKKPKTQALSIPDMDEFSDDDEDVSPKLEHMDGNRKMTDEEKRKNFLERNRVAALKCRQRKKQWLQSLQAKVEYYSTENEALNQQVTTLREEILNLKTLIIAHKDCPITQQQGLSGMALANLLGDFPAPHGHPYGIAMQGGMQNGLPPQGFSMAPAPPAPMHRS